MIDFSLFLLKITCIGFSCCFFCFVVLSGSRHLLAGFFEDWHLARKAADNMGKIDTTKENIN